VLAQRRREVAEVGAVAGIADPEEDLLALWQQRAGPGRRRCAQAEQRCRKGDQGDSTIDQAHPSLIRRR
jgi:hypothetical protein